MLKTYKYRLYPNCDQQLKIDQTMGICRLVYNLALETKITAWQSARKKVSAYELINQLPDLKKANPWMAEINSQALQGAINNLDKAFSGFFKGKGFPKFKSKKGHQSFQCPNNTRRIDFKNSTLTIPKIKNIPIVTCREFKGRIKTITISKTTTGKYFAAILVDNEESLLKKQTINSEKTIGIDVGLKSFVVTSSGLVHGPNRRLKENIKRLQCLQKRACRKKKGSKNQKKANKLVALIHEKIANKRVDYCHKITSQIVHDSQVNTFVIEDLNVKGMIKNRKLSQAISDTSFAEFFRQMKYKCEWYGKNLIVIDRFAPSSKRCSDCGEINQELTLADREWTCACGSHHDRDLNAAKNIKWYGLQQTIFKNKTPEGIGEGPVESSLINEAMKQEFVSIEI